MGQKLFFEYLEVLERPEHFSDCPINKAEREELFYGFLSVCTWIEVFYLWRPNLPDEGDNHVLELGVAGGASAVVTFNVGDFRGELRFPRIQIATPGEFLKTKMSYGNDDN